MSHTDPSQRRLVITGVGFRAGEGTDSQGSIFDTAGIKPNIGATVALEAARAGYRVALVARTEAKLRRARASIREAVPSAEVQICPTDLLQVESVRNLIEGVEASEDIDLVHCAGLSAGDYRLSGDNPYLAVDDVPSGLSSMEFTAVVESLLNLVQASLPRLRQQSQSRLVVVSSMSGIRAYPMGYAHASAKAGLHHAVRSLTLELNPQGIQVSEVLPGMVNTGTYDSPEVDTAIRAISRSFGYDYGDDPLPQMEPRDIADAVLLCLRSGSHVLSIAMVAKGQLPHHGA